MLLSGKTEIASPEKLSGHNQSRFRILEYDRIPAPDSIFYSELHRCVVQCVCVCFLPIHSGHQVRWTYQPGSHRRKVTQDF